MNVKLNANAMKVSDLAVNAEGIIPDTAVLRDVRVSKAKDSEGNFTEHIEAVRYDCIDPNTYALFTLKVDASSPVISKEDLDAAEEPVYITIPVEKIVIKPYEIAYGVAKVSIVAPYVKVLQE